MALSSLWMALFCHLFSLLLFWKDYDITCVRKKAVPHSVDAVQDIQQNKIPMQILEAVNTSHEEHSVHSDLKPANFLLVK
ncbi:hypothetical protein Patl1_34815 [Pistacia atlantica]|uniref:Uncharacterized protein n=1 Tax=Pistacia atlantica TaxID=434234 RepID=A0ACC0ZTN7_9ROSI|nr:hypothetical protein Patl1_34815 [Pistacia atlantica]